MLFYVKVVSVELNLQEGGSLSVMDRLNTKYCDVVKVHPPGTTWISSFSRVVPRVAPLLLAREGFYMFLMLHVKGRHTAREALSRKHLPKKIWDFLRPVRCSGKPTCEEVEQHEEDFRTDLENLLDTI
jgi:alpha-D-ribose 1-methylphosphonate 5-triphosphate synthase subunit PhnL